MKKHRPEAANKGGVEAGATEAEAVVAKRAEEGEIAAAAQGEAEAAAAAMPFAAVSEAEAKGLALSPAQRTAIERLTRGETMVDAAAAAGVNRTTLYRWLKSDAAFAAAYNAWQQDAIATARGRLLALTDTAVTAVGKAMLRGDGKLALRVLERMGIAERPMPGATDEEELKREQGLERRKAEVKRRKEVQDVVIEENCGEP